MKKKREYLCLLTYFTFSRAETDSSQELIAHHGLSVPHGQLQTHPVQLLQSQILVHKRVVVVGIQVLLHHWSLPLCGLCLSWEQVPAEAQTQS